MKNKKSDNEINESTFPLNNDRRRDQMMEDVEPRRDKQENPKNKKVAVMGAGKVKMGQLRTMKDGTQIVIVGQKARQHSIVTWDTPILEITQHPLFPGILKNIIDISVRNERTGQSREFYQLFGWINAAEKVIQEYYKITIKQSQCSSRIRALIERLIKVSCYQLIQKFDERKGTVAAEETAGKI